jgi:hypothetical protein
MGIDEKVPNEVQLPTIAGYVLQLRGDAGCLSGPCRQPLASWFRTTPEEQDELL